MPRPIAATLLTVLILSHPGRAETEAQRSEAQPVRFAHPPLGITGGYTLDKGAVEIAYSYERQRYEGLRDGTQSLDAADAILLYGFVRAPLTHDVDRHDITLRYAPVHRITLVANLPVLSKELVEVDGAGAVTRSTSSGVGDLTLTAIAHFIERGNEVLFFSAELGTPTGSIRENDASGERLPYAMQLGTGSWHVETGLSYQGETTSWAWGGQFTTLFRLNTNELGYRHGNEYRVSGWLSRRWLDCISSSLRLEWHKWGNFRGADPQLMPMRSPTESARDQSGEHIDVAAGLDLRLPFLSGSLGAQSLALEAVWPVFRKIEGPQLDEEWRVRAGWRWAF